MNKINAKEAGFVSCHICHLLAPIGQKNCNRCGVKLHLRRPDSLSRSWALLISACLLYIPANLLPILKASQFDNTQADTIFSGVLHLVHAGMIPIAIVVFSASILIPSLKLIGMIYLLLSIQFDLGKTPEQKIKLYRFIEWVGRWSMLDIFVIAILTALVNMGSLARIEAGPGALAFAFVVILTMFSALSFDPRLIIDPYFASQRTSTEPAKNATE